MWPDADPAPGPVPVLAGGAHGPRGVCREVGHRHRLDSPGQRVSGTRERVRIRRREGRLTSGQHWWRPGGGWPRTGSGWGTWGGG